MRRGIVTGGAVLATLLAAAALSPRPAQAAGFAIIEQSVSGLGNAFAGGAAAAEDASTIFFNPAGMTRLKGQNVSTALHVIVLGVQFENQGSTHAFTGATGQGLTGPDGGDAGETGLVPNFYYALSLDSGWAFGLGVGAPFGLVTDYPSNWVGRYHALRSDVLTININPAVAYEVTDKLSLGVGLNFMYMDVNLSQAIDFGSITAAAGGIPQQEDGEADLNGDDWGYGFNLGLLYQFSPNTRAGIHYRSRVKQELEGDADFTVPTKTQGILAALGSGAFVDTDMSGDITLPDTLSVSLYHRFNPKFALMGDVTWANWSTFDELKIEFDNPEQPDSITTEDWDDSWRYSLGCTYTPVPGWDLRAGLAYDTTPIPNSERRTPRLPGEDRYWIALGTGYRISDWFSFDIGYAHLFVPKAEIDKDPVGEDATKGGLKGEFEYTVDIISAQLNFNW